MSSAYLDVSHSLSGRRWLLRPADERVAATLSQRLGLPEVVARVLAGRGVGVDDAAAFLSPTLRGLLPDPSHLLDMDRAAARLAAAVMAGERIAVFGDYDVDGATSAALLVRFLRAVGAAPVVYIPDRMTEGYGPNAPALLRLRAEGAQVAVTVDCGITAFAPLEAAAAAGLEVVVIDHHAAEPRLPPAVAVVNPKRLDETSPHGHLAAVGVAFLLVVAINRALRAGGWYADGRPEPDLMGWLDLVALGTVADVVPLVGVNRALVTQGLKVLAKRGNTGLAALCDAAGVKERPDAYHLGYVLGPRVNAGGRVGQSDLGVRLLTCDDAAEAGVLALRLCEHNSERQGIEAAVLLEAIEQVESRAPMEDAPPLVLAAAEGWHPGVLGIVASRLKERFGLPACVLGIEDGIAKGSGRSVRGLDLGAAVIAAREAGLLIAGGGHAMAAGFTLDAAKIPDFQAFLIGRLRDQVEGRAPVATLDLDGAVDIRGATADLVETLARLGPFGAGNDEPRFVLPGVQIARADVVGQGHVRCILSGPLGGRLKAIAFRCADDALGLALLTARGQRFHLAGTLRLDTWQGRNEAQLIIDDAAPAG